MTYLDAHRWEQLILHYYPQLEKFYFTYYDRMNNDNQYQIYSGQSLMKNFGLGGKRRKGKRRKGKRRK
ncbi:unnamed protein product [Rotaria magnacalcarata]|uniref:Uncharacterized protein n=1 Tax=Rotaria magnacalcarata TaxID=392030 RepID=A0A8S3C2Q4_9BILA|nr:unnamed protein product [Rotaria magnacalcarata]